MALPFDIDIYNDLLQGILGVQPTGDPVADAVYLVLLPMIVLYMYTDFVVTKSRFMGHSGKLKTIMMFIIGFTIVYYKYYGFFAALSLPLLGIIMIYHTFSFIFGRKNNSDKAGYQEGSGNKNTPETTWGSLLLKKTGISGAISAANPFEMEDAKIKLRRLNGAWKAEERLHRTSNAQLLMQNNGTKEILDGAIDALDKFDEKTRDALIKDLDKDFKKCIEELFK